MTIFISFLGIAGRFAGDLLAALGDATGGGLATGVHAAFRAIDASLLELAVPTDEWDILYRLRLGVERDLLIGAKPGTEFPMTSSRP